MAVRRRRRAATSSGACRAPIPPPGRSCSARISTRCATRASTTARSACSCALAGVARLRAEEVTLPFASRCSASPTRKACAIGSAYLGSRALAGTLDDALLDTADAGGVTVRDALGIRRCAAGRGETLLGYCRGPHRAGAGAGAARPPGRRGHRDRGRDARAGAVHRPRGPRRDDADGACGATRCAALAELVLAVEARRPRGRRARRHRGRMEALPGAPNVIRARRWPPLDVRHADDARPGRGRRRDRGAPREAIAAARGVTVAWRDLLRHRRRSPCDPGSASCSRRRRRGRASRRCDWRAAPATTRSRSSALAPVAMLFVRCAGGV